MYNIEVAREIYKRLLENGVNISLAGIPIVEEVLNEEDEHRRTKRALDLPSAKVKYCTPVNGVHAAWCPDDKSASQ